MLGQIRESAIAYCGSLKPSRVVSSWESGLFCAAAARGQQRGHRLNASHNNVPGRRLAARGATRSTTELLQRSQATSPLHDVNRYIRLSFEPRHQ